MKAHGLTFLLIIWALTNIHAQNMPDFEFKGKLRATNFLCIPADMYPTAADVNGDYIPDLILGTRYSQIYQSDFSLIFNYDRETDSFTYYDSLRNARGNVLLGFMPIAADINHDDTLELVVRPQYQYLKYQMYKQTDSNRFSIIDTLKYLNGETISIDGAYTFYKENLQNMDLYKADFDNTLEFYKNDSLYTFRNPYYLTDPSHNFLTFNEEINYLSFFKRITTSGNNTTYSTLYVSSDDSCIYSFGMLDSTNFISYGKVTDADNNTIKAEEPQAVVKNFYRDTIYDMLLFRKYKAPVQYRQGINGWTKKSYLTAKNYFLQTFYFPDIYFYDINKDDNEDAFISDIFGHILVSLRDGNNNYFLLPDTLKAGGKAIEIGSIVNFALDDLDNDGKLDLFVGDYSGNLLYFKQVEAYNFEFADTLQKAGQRLTMTIGDFYADGQKELAVAQQNNGNFIFYKFTGNTLEEVYTSEFYGNFPVISDGDINGDGFDDILLLYSVNYPNDHIWFLLNDGNGNFSVANNEYGDFFVGTTNSSIATTDLNNDGKPDVVLPQDNGSVDYWINKTTHNSVKNHYITDLSVYPNPAKQQLNIGLNCGKILTYKIIDLQGRVVQKGVLRGEKVLDVNKLKTGVYCVEIISDTQIYHAKFVKEE